MENNNFSSYLKKQKPILKKLLDKLSNDFKYVSILGTDTKGKEFKVSKTETSLNDHFLSERGFVLRVFNGINYSEFSFNNLKEDDIDSFAEEIKSKFNSQLSAISSSNYPISNYKLLEEESISKSFDKPVKLPLNKLDNEKIITLISNLSKKGLDFSDLIIDFRISFEILDISKIFISNNKDLEQNYTFSTAFAVSISQRDSNTKFYYGDVSGLKGGEILDELPNIIDKVASTSVQLLDASNVTAGEYDVICDPGISGLIAHEAFGHGVEMDMFVKNRAKAKEYIGKPVASEIVSMRDGANSYTQVASYAFDDEGILAHDTLVIDKGILNSGLCDTLSSLKLNCLPTGNGRRESFERKAYARMTNTFFEAGNSTLDNMISSIKNGYLIESTFSGMEDPKNWGIQCVAGLGREIKNGKLTGKLVSPLIMTGYVPDLLNSISMVSNKIELSGSGYCGKGYKEYVKVSDGGPYIKAKVRLG